MQKTLVLIEHRKIASVRIYSRDTRNRHGIFFGNDCTSRRPQINIICWPCLNL